MCEQAAWENGPTSRPLPSAPPVTSPDPAPAPPGPGPRPLPPTAHAPVHALGAPGNLTHHMASDDLDRIEAALPALRYWVRRYTEESVDLPVGATAYLAAQAREATRLLRRLPQVWSERQRARATCAVLDQRALTGGEQ